MFETPEEKSQPILKVREMAKEVADDLIIAYGAEIYLYGYCWELERN